MKARSQQGFTLIELMVTVAIVGIITAIAIPSYQSYMVRSNRAAAQSFMLSVANQQEQFLLDNRAYAFASNLDQIIAQLRVTVPNSKVREFYTMTITENPVGNPRTFVITATPKAGTMQTKDGAMTLSHRGQKTPPGKW